MINLNNALRLMIIIFVRILRFALLSIAMILIAGLGLLALWLLFYSLQNMSWSNWLQPLQGILLFLILLFIIPILVLQFFEDRPLARRLIQWFRRMLRLITGVVIIFAVPYGILTIVVIGVTIAWFLVLFAFDLSPFSSSASQYAIATFSLLMFTLLGQKATRWSILWVTDKTLKADWLYYLLQKSLVRFYIYALLAVAYLVYNLENLSGLVLLSWPWWQGFKGGILEILLTYAAFDAVYTAWHDHGEESKSQSFWKLFLAKS